MTTRARFTGATLFSAAAVVLGVLAAWPIYLDWWLLVPAASGLVLGVAIAALGARRLTVAASVGVLIAAFVLTVVPVAVPGSFDRLPQGLLNGLIDGVAAVALGWKQLLTLALPVGSYQTVMVPAYVVFLLTGFLVTTLAVRAGRFAPLAAFPMLLPVLFGTVFGASSLSAPLRFGPVAIAAPREIGLWLLAVLLGASWVWLSAGADRRAALRRGRESSGGHGSAFSKPLIGTVTVLVALVAGIALAPMIDSGPRQVPRDRIDPEIVLRERASPLAGYRAWKRDDTLDQPLFTVTSDGVLPERLRLAVLDSYDGVDFRVGDDEAGHFTRFPSAPRVSDPATVTVRIDEGYADIWVPSASLGSVPVFIGSRGAELSDSFFVSRSSNAAIVAPGGSSSIGLVQGDGLRAVMSTTPSEALTGGPAANTPGIDLDAMPELQAWLSAQDQPATAEGLIELLQRLRDRGYLSHSISDADGQRLWLERLAERYGTRFETSAGGHSLARLEQLFAQLNTQQRLARDGASPEMLVAGVGDDEQFAAAGALIARALGFDSRVVIGVRLGGEDAGVPGIPACAAECTGEHLAAWVEVRGERGAWVPLDVTPQLELRPTVLEEGEQLPEFATTPEERDVREVDPPLGLGERSDAAEQAGEQPITSWVWPVLRAVGLSFAALVLLLLPLLFLPVAKRVRAGRRRAEADPELRALGAWQQLIDEASDAGVRVPDTASRAEVARALGTPAAVWAATTADRAVFSPAGISAADADLMWRAVAADRAARKARMGGWQRLRQRYSLRSFGVGVVKPGKGAKESAAAPNSHSLSKEPSDV